jgi:uncharacterized membrane protein
VLGKHTLKPGEKTGLKITYNTTGRPGVFRKDIDIETDAQGQEEMHLTMQGTVKETPGAKIQVTPRKLDLGTIKTGESQDFTITVRNTGELPLDINKISGQGSGHVYFEGLKGGDIVIESGKSEAVVLTVKPVQTGQFADRVAIQSNAKNAPKGGFIIMVNGTAE